jgi:putative phosphoribosyl transferase
VGFFVAHALGVPLDVVVVRKLGVPWQPELAMGAIAGGRIRILDEELIQDLGIPKAQVDAVVIKEMNEVDRRETLYRNGRPAADLRGWTAILVDDGLATGSSMTAALGYVNSFHPAAVIVAAPVGASKTYQHFKRAAADCVCVSPRLSLLTLWVSGMPISGR